METPTEPPSRSVRIRRFPDWRALRRHVAEEVRRDSGSLLLLTATDGGCAALDDAIRQRLLAGREPAARLPAVRTPALAVAELLQHAEPPGTLATPLARSLMMENALLAHQHTGGAPRGNPLRFAGPLLGFLDEQASDRRVDPGRPAFGALLRRAARTFGEHREADAGAERLFRLTGWLEAVHRSYLEQLRASGALDLDAARRCLLGASAAPPWSEIRAVGDRATGLADNHLFGSLIPPGRLHFFLLEDDPPPELPEGWIAAEEAAAPAAATHPFVFVPDPPEDDEPWLFRRTDRAGEARAAVALLRRYHQRSGLGFPGFDRCAIAVRRPAATLEALAARLTEAGIPFQTRIRPSLAEEPWSAGLDDALAFAERPGRLSNGMTLLRSPFFRDERLPLPPGRLADLAESCLAEADIPNTHDPDRLEALAGRVRRLADDRLADARKGVDGGSDEGSARRDERAGRDLGLAADAVARLAAYARALAPIRDRATLFRNAVQAFAAFVGDHFGEAPDDAPLEALRQAADPALPDTPVGDPVRFRDRVRRQLRRQETTRYPSRSGVHLIGAEDAPFGDYDCLLLLGVGDADWPGPRPGNIFF
ncbi:MAG: hypothetical protein F4Y71_03265, partial [Acidobacteria bacterium]|nr:hypothetical protein [Acidobacteriota bacterium]